jgi:hypothetical protein
VSSDPTIRLKRHDLAVLHRILDEAETARQKADVAVDRMRRCIGEAAEILNEFRKQLHS